MRYNKPMRYLLILILLASCGKPSSKCVGKEEATLRCKAEVVGRWYPVQASQFELNQCERFYPVQSCY